ncbi:MAG TPA: DUF4124 domain-containing protein [Nevskiaceae bacterium]|nr:DUF4124 domain-containing protein [Nevskiaceae bacterium]
MFRTVAVLGLLLAAQAHAGVGVYKWVDAEGKVHFTDQPTGNQPVQQVNTSTLPLGLQDRLRSLDHNLSITHFDGDTTIGIVCAEFDTDYVTSEPVFAQAVEAAKLGTVKTTSSYYDSTRSSYYWQAPARQSYDPRKCPRSSSKKRTLQSRMYEIRFNPDAVSVYRSEESHGH